MFYRHSENEVIVLLATKSLYPTIQASTVVVTDDKITISPQTYNALHENNMHMGTTGNFKVNIAN